MIEVKTGKGSDAMDRRRQLSAALTNARGMPTPRGRKWYAASDRNVLARRETD